MANFSPALHRFSRLAGVLVMLIGAGTLVGWAANAPSLRRILPGLVEMKANTAACFVLAGFALQLVRDAPGPRARRLVSEVCAWLVLVIALVTLTQYLTSWDAGLDELFFRDDSSRTLDHPPGRMAFATAVAFLVTALALRLVARRQSLVLAQYLTFAAILIPLTSILAYLFGDPAIYVGNAYTSLAVNTAAAFALLGAGLLGACEGVGPMAVITADDSGGVLIRRLLPIAAGITLTLGALALLGARSGLFSHASGMIVFALVNAVALSAVIWYNASSLSRLDAVRIRAEQELFATIERRESAFKAGGMGIWDWNPATNALVWSESLEHLYGLEPGGFAGDLDSFFKLIVPEDREPMRKSIMDALASEEDGFNAVARIPLPDGSTRFVNGQGQVVRDADRRPIRLTGICWDVTDFERTLRALRESEEKFRTIATVLPQIVWMARADGHVDYYNERWTEYTGLTPEQSTGSGWVVPIHPDDHARSAQRWNDAVAAGLSYETEQRFRGPDGRYRWFLTRALPMKDDDGRVVRWFGTCTDVEDKIRAEQAAEVRAFQLKKLAEASSRINAAHDVDTLARVVNDEARALIGTHLAATNLSVDPATSELSNAVAFSPGGCPDDTLPDESEALARFDAHHARGARTLRISSPAPDQHDQGPDDFCGGWLAALLVGRDGRRMGLIQLADKEHGDFTEDDEAILDQLARIASVAVENVRLYQELRENDRRKDEFLAMLAHELRNPLAAITNAVALASREGGLENAPWSLDVVQRQSRHLSRLIDDLLDVSRISRGKIRLRREVVDAAVAIENAIATVRPRIEQKGQPLDVELDRGCLWLDADPTRLEQVVVNLLGNASKYSEDGRAIRLSARREGDEVVLRIRDDGVGIPPDQIPRMFELFAQGDRSLARSEGGLGIGLTLVKKLVDMHGGQVTAASEGAGRGSEFVVRLPAVARPARKLRIDKPAPPKPPRTSDSGQGCRILVVDDNIDTARGMSRLLKHLGHDVKTAHTGPDAITSASAHRPHVVLLDIGLPGMDGYQVAATLRADPATPPDALIIAVSGYGQEEDRRRSKQAGFDHHFVKPLDHDALISLISKA